MKFVLVFLLLSSICLVEASLLGGWAWLLVWPGCAYLGVGLAYAGLGPRLLGKRADGSLAPWAVLFFLPYLLPTWVLWNVLRLCTSEPACQQIAPGLWLSRRLAPAEVPATATLIVDLTAEFFEPRMIRKRLMYLAHPTLDGHVPSAEDLRCLVQRITSAPGEVLVHCASGHGRAPMVMACVLIAKGIARDLEEAERIIKSIRPRIGLSRAQRKSVEEFSRNLASGGRPPS
jgi:protein-tyrosine phosphatase